MSMNLSITDVLRPKIYLQDCLQNDNNECQMVSIAKVILVFSNLQTSLRPVVISGFKRNALRNVLSLQTDI